MKDTIIYGVRGLRKKIEASLSDNFRIIGYSDSDTIYRDVKEYEYKPFYAPEALGIKSYDYILISVSDKSKSYDIVNYLIKVGVPQNKIIETCYIINSVYSFDIPLIKFPQITEAFDGLCFGMSYSYNTFFTHFFSKRFYKLSYYGADLYFHNKNISYLLLKQPSLLTGIKYIVFDLPYYIFNWDLSRAKKTIRNRFSLLENFNDYHNYGSDTIEQWYIEEYQILKEMFYQSLSTNTSSYSNNYEDRNNNDFMRSPNNFSTLEHVWTTLRDETIEENISLFLRILSSLNSFNPSIKIAVVIFPMYLPFLNMEEIRHMKALFYRIINDFIKSFEIEIFDCFEMFQDKSLFFDVQHLNAFGGYKLSSYLEEIFQKQFY